jgi:hypothetical protein
MLTGRPTVLRTLSSEGPMAELTSMPSLLKKDPRDTINCFSTSVGLLMQRVVYGPSAAPSSVAAAVIVAAGTEGQPGPLCCFSSLDQALG